MATSGTMSSAATYSVSNRYPYLSWGILHDGSNYKIWWMIGNSGRGSYTYDAWDIAVRFTFTKTDGTFLYTKNYSPINYNGLDYQRLFTENYTAETGFGGIDYVPLETIADGEDVVRMLVYVEVDQDTGGTWNFHFQDTWNVNVSYSVPSAPTSFTITAGNGNYVGLGETVTLTWSGASGKITGYDIQYSRGSSGWNDYKSVSSTSTGGSTTDSFTSTDITINGAGNKVQYRIRAKNGSYASSWKTSNTLTMSGGMDIKVNGTWKTGSVWIKVNGTWKRARRVYMNVNGTWKQSI